MGQTALGKISVACCTLNGQKFLRQQLLSIVNQTRRVDQIVLCDDGSTDDTLRIARDVLAGAAPSVGIHRNSERLGVTKNFEQAISLATGDIIFLSDQDDVWLPEKTARMMDQFADPSVAMVFSNAQVVDQELVPAGYTLWDSVWFDAGEQRRLVVGDALPVLLRHAVAAGTTLAFRGRFKSLLLPMPDLPHCHDIWISLLLACVGTAQEQDHGSAPTLALPRNTREGEKKTLPGSTLLTAGRSTSGGENAELLRHGPAAKICPLDENLIQYRLHGENEVGLRRHGLFGQIRMARWQLRFGAFKYAADLHQAALDRLGDGITDDGDVANLLREKIAHSLIRQNLPRFWPARIPSITRELVAGRYAKYSYGYKSVLQDLFLR